MFPNFSLLRNTKSCIGKVFDDRYNENNENNQVEIHVYT